MVTQQDFIDLLAKPESETLDFKGKAYNMSSDAGRADLLKDVLSMTNTPRDRPAYIVLGVKKHRDGTYDLWGLDQLHDDADFQSQFIDRVRPIPWFSYQVIEYQSKQFAVICIRPFPRGVGPATLIRDYFGLPKGQVYFRRGSRNDIATDETLVSLIGWMRTHEGGTFIIPDANGEPVSQLGSFANPYDFNTTATRQMFKGREREIQELLDAVESGTHTAVFGLQRIGKTSLVDEALVERVKDRDSLRGRTLFANVDLQQFGSQEIRYKDLFQEIIYAISRAACDEMGRRDLADAIDMFLDERLPYQRGRKMQLLTDYCTALEKIVDAVQARIVVFIDEFSELCRAIERNEELFAKRPSRNDRLHPNEMLVDVAFMHWLSSLLKNSKLKNKLVFVFAMRPFVAEYDRQRELQILKLTKPIILYYLEDEAAKSLIRDPLRGVVRYDEDAVNYLCDLTSGHPYLIQFILKEIIGEIRREGRRTITVKDVQKIEQRMISEGPGYDGQFEVLDSDYSVDEVMNPKRARLGRGTLAVLAMLGHERKQGWVEGADLVGALAKHGCAAAEVYGILDQLVRSKIVEEARSEGILYFRMWIPLLRKRYVTQNMYLKFFEGTHR